MYNLNTCQRLQFLFLLTNYLHYRYNGNELYYILKDHLGSYSVILDESGAIVEELSYDAWGRRRSVGNYPNNWRYNNLPTQFLFARGFTGHSLPRHLGEHLDEFNLINMNGRVYDPYLGLFLSPDNYVQFPASTHSYNRYSYALNNPLIYTDPSGNEFKLWKALLTVPFGMAAFSPGFKWANGDISLGQAAGEYLVNVSAFLVGAGVGKAVGDIYGTVGFINGAITAGAAGYAGAFTSGFGNHLVYGGNVFDAYGEGLKQGAIGGITSGAIGGISGGIQSQFDNTYNRNFWNGRITGVKNPQIIKYTMQLPNSPVLITDRGTVNPCYDYSSMCYDGQYIQWYDVYDDGSIQFGDYWQAHSGTRNPLPANQRNGRIPNGLWHVTDITSTQQPSSYVRDGVGFYADLTPQFTVPATRNPSSFEIHPDGHPLGFWWLNNGTNGCIGIQERAGLLNSFYNQVNMYLSRNPYIILNVFY